MFNLSWLQSSGTRLSEPLNTLLRNCRDTNPLVLPRKSNDPIVKIKPACSRYQRKRTQTQQRIVCGIVKDAWWKAVFRHGLQKMSGKLGPRVSLLHLKNAAGDCPGQTHFTTSNNNKTYKFHCGKDKCSLMKHRHQCRALSPKALGSHLLSKSTSLSALFHSAQFVFF